jgi:hypothetical protein
MRNVAAVMVRRNFGRVRAVDRRVRVTGVVRLAFVRVAGGAGAAWRAGMIAGVTTGGAGRMLMGAGAGVCMTCKYSFFGGGPHK